MKVVSIVGARPQFIKAAPVCRALRKDNEEILVHSGQHYDHGMSDIFFEQLGIPEPDYNLGVGSGGHGFQTGAMMGPLEKLLDEQCPDIVIVYGDTNTTLAGALASAKLGIPVAHVEAGLRSFNRAMPEEINRVVADHLSELLLCPTETAVQNLAREGITTGVELVGDVMFDTARHFIEETDSQAALSRFGVEEGRYFFATVHRASNSDDAEKLAAIVSAFTRLDMPVVWAVHPRTKANLEAFGLDSVIADAVNLRAVPPVSYMDAISLISNAAGVLTDSGGMQKEAYFFGIPCVTLREETEWVETVEMGWNTLTGADEEAIAAAASDLSCPTEHPSIYGDGHAAEAVVAAIEKHVGRTG